MTTKVTSLVLANTAVTSGTYGGSSIIPVVTVDAQGRLTLAANATPSIANSQITGVITASQLAATAVTPATYGGSSVIPVVTVDQQGRLTSAANATPSIAISTQVSGLGTNVATALAVAVGSAGAFVTNGGALGTPSSGTLTNCTFPTLNQNTTGSAATFTSTTQNSQFNSIGVGTAASANVGEIRATSTITAGYSDDNLKTKLGTIENALDKVMLLTGFYYEPNQTAQDLGFVMKKEVGVSAQEVQKVLPEVVVPAPIDDKYLTVQYERMIPLLIEAIKELKNELTDLRNNKQ